MPALVDVHEPSMNPPYWKEQNESQNSPIREAPDDVGPFRTSFGVSSTFRELSLKHQPPSLDLSASHSVVFCWYSEVHIL